MSLVNVAVFREVESADMWLALKPEASASLARLCWTCRDMCYDIGAAGAEIMD